MAKQSGPKTATQFSARGKATPRFVAPLQIQPPADEGQGGSGQDGAGQGDESKNETLELTTQAAEGPKVNDPFDTSLANLPVELSAPEGATSLTWQGEVFTVVDGAVTVPCAAVEELAAHGFKRK